MDIRTHRDGEELRIELEGRLDAAWSGSVGQAFQDALHTGCHRIALDLSGVSYLSSAGIRVLAILAKQLRNIGGRLRILDPAPPVRDVLQLVGFHNLLNGPPPPSAAPRGEAVGPRVWRSGGQDFEVYDLNPGAVLRGARLGQPGTLGGGAGPATPAAIRRVGETALAVGVGALGRDECPSRAGELLAAGGVAITLPGNDPGHPDWQVQEGELIPEIGLLSGLWAEGGFRHLLRFGVASEAPMLGLAGLAEAALNVCGTTEVALVAIAETGSLVGAALQAAPSRIADDMFAFPAIRDRMLFTAEPAHANEACLIVGFAARAPVPPLADFLRPMGTGSELHAHCHAAVFPYRPVRKGLIELRNTLDGLMEGETVRGVLHLLHDDREGVGAGQSLLRRGALWCAPVNFEDA